MTVKEFAHKAGLKNFTGNVSLDHEMKGGYVSDLLSDVMGNAAEGDVWITLQSHMNVVAIASLKELAAVVLVSDHVPAQQVIDKATENNIPLLGGSASAFELAGILYNLLNS